MFSFFLNYASYNYSKANWSGLCNYFSSVDWVTEFRCCTSGNEYRDIFEKLIFMGIDEFLLKYVRTRHTVNVKLYPRHIAGSVHIYLFIYKKCSPGRS